LHVKQTWKTGCSKVTTSGSSKSCNKPTEETILITRRK
jgi:hypothetical protein